MKECHSPTVRMRAVINGDECPICLRADFDAKSRECAALKELLRVAKCPANCIDGAITWDSGGECEQEQCQFCYERDAALKEPT